MDRATSRNLFFASLASVLLLPLVALAVHFLNIGLGLGTATSSIYIGILIVGLVSFTLGFIGYVGALVKLARLEQWVWFILLILFAPIVMLVYIFAGPTKPPTTVP
jgi:hypothetical protein